MLYNFPIIETIEDVLPHIKGREEFIVTDKSDYIVINYTHRTSDTFPELRGPNDHEYAVLRECRGIVFSPNGKIMSRPYHKFFNVNETSEVSESKVLDSINFSYSKYMLEKLDGSMIRPLFFEDECNFYFGTKMGMTDTSAQVDAWYKKNHSDKLFDFIMDCYENGLTPIFEWCSRKNRIVLDYPEDRLVLTAVRHLRSGLYVSYEVLDEYAKNYDLDLVRKIENSNVFEVMKSTSSEEQIEGYVVRLETLKDTIHMVKVKCEWYVALHKTKEALRREKDVLPLILDDMVDDLLPLMNDEDKEKVLSYQKDVWAAIAKVSNEYNSLVIQARAENVTAKEFALVWVKNVKVEPIAFTMFNKEVPARDAIVDWLKKQCSSNKKVNGIRLLLGENVKYQEIEE